MKKKTNQVFARRLSAHIIKWLQARLDKAVLFLAVQFLISRAIIRILYFNGVLSISSISTSLSTAAVRSSTPVQLNTSTLM